MALRACSGPHLSESIVSRPVLSIQLVWQAWAFGNVLVDCRCYENPQLGHLRLNLSGIWWEEPEGGLSSGELATKNQEKAKKKMPCNFLVTMFFWFM
jgi:hypothetical protein